MADLSPQMPAVEGDLVSVIMANRNGAAYLERAVRSVLDQTHARLELVFSDDGSTDDSLAILQRIAAEDARVKIVASPQATGPGAARNRALAQATGDWIAIFDSDDIMHPQRLARLLAAAGQLGADLVADDLIYFGDDPLEQHITLLQRLDLQAPVTIDARALVTGRLQGKRDLSFGYLKPMIRRAALGTLRYNEALRIDEDYDLYLRLLIAGNRFVVLPDGFYLYRRHANSTSHRASSASLERMVQVQAAFLRDLPPGDTALATAIAARIGSHARELGYARMIDALRARRWGRAAGCLFRDPRHLLSLGHSLSERLRRKRLKKHLVRSELNLLLCARGRAAAFATPGFTAFEVPETPAALWSPSAATVWADLARLACRHDLHILAADAAGIFALGLVPQFLSARILDPQPPARTDVPPARATALFMQPWPVQEGT